MRARRRLSAHWLACLLAPVGVGAAADADPFVGTWSLDRAASHYTSRDLPARMVIIMESVPGGIHYRSDALRMGDPAVGAAHMTADYTAQYDGTLAMVMGNSGMLVPVQLRRLDQRSVQADYVRGFQKVASSVRVVSADGTRMTITTTSKAGDGKEVVNIGVYTKTMP